MFCTVRRRKRYHHFAPLRAQHSKTTGKIGVPHDHRSDFQVAHSSPAVFSQDRGNRGARHFETGAAPSGAAPSGAVTSGSRAESSVKIPLRSCLFASEVSSGDNSFRLDPHRRAALSRLHSRRPDKPRLPVAEAGPPSSQLAVLQEHAEREVRAPRMACSTN